LVAIIKIKNKKFWGCPGLFCWLGLLVFFLFFCVRGTQKFFLIFRWEISSAAPN
jgi:hypothetical protein